jgi:hypothetical protein
MQSRASSNPHVNLSSGSPPGASPEGGASAFHGGARSVAAPQAPAYEASAATDPLPSGNPDLDATALPPRAAVGWSPTSWRMALSSGARG